MLIIITQKTKILFMHHRLCFDLDVLIKDSMEEGYDPRFSIDVGQVLCALH